MMTPFVTPGLEKHTIPHAITASTRPSTNDSTTPLMFSVTCGNTRRSTLSGNQLLLSATGQSLAASSTKTGGRIQGPSATFPKEEMVAYGKKLRSSGLAGTSRHRDTVDLGPEAGGDRRRSAAGALHGDAR